MMVILIKTVFNSHGDHEESTYLTEFLPLTDSSNINGNMVFSPEDEIPNYDGDEENFCFS